MKAAEIKKLRAAQTIAEVCGMVDCREFEHDKEKWIADIKKHLERQYNERVGRGMSIEEALSWGKASVVSANGGSMKQQIFFWSEARKIRDA